MKKNKFAEFFKGKGYYVLLFVGVIAIAAVAIIGSNLASNKRDKEQERIDLNDVPDNNLADEGDDDLVADDNQASDDVANNQSDSTGDVAIQDEGQDVVNNDDLIEFDIYAEEEEEGIDLADAEETAADNVADKDDENAVETSGKTVQADVAPQLSFNKEEDSLLWPVEGNVLMNYSMDHVIYYSTLMQYKCNPAIIIDAEVDTEVRAAAKGVVSSIDTNEETGLTVTMDIGDGFSLVYGQLKDVSLKEGSRVNEGEIIGSIAKPTKYYLIEGSNLYFKVLEKDETVNPMLYLR